MSTHVRECMCDEERERERGKVREGIKAEGRERHVMLQKLKKVQ